MALKFFVGVPHTVNFLKDAVFNPKIRKFTGGYEIASLKTDLVLNAELEVVEVGNLDGIPDFRKKVLGCDEYPKGYDVVIVSAVYASAYRETYGSYPPSMRVPSDPVMTEDGKTFRGCRGLCAPF